MPLFTDPKSQIKSVLVKGCTIVWEGVLVPESMDDGGQKRTLKLVVPPGSPDTALLEQLANEELQRSDFRGVLPAGGYMPVAAVGADEFEGKFPGHACFRCRTYRMPDVYDEAGQRMDPMQYGPLLYSGQKVDVLVTCRAYNNKSKGVAAQLEGFSIIASAGAVQQSFGAGGVDTAAAFGQQHQAAHYAQNPAPAMQQQPAQAHDFLPGGPGAPGAPAGPGGPGAPAAAAAPPRYNAGDGHAPGWSEAELVGAGYTPAQVAALPRV